MYVKEEVQGVCGICLGWSVYEEIIYMDEEPDPHDRGGQCICAHL